MALSLGPPIPKVVDAISRGGLVNRVVTQLRREQVVFLHGSSGVGKTNLASLVTCVIGGDWRWGGFRGRSPDYIQQILIRIAYEIETAEEPILMVLDDLEFSGISQFEREFVALIFAVVQRNGLVILTGIVRPPLNVFPKLWLSVECEISIPHFSETEVGEFLVLHGLEDSKQIDSWARVIYLSTSGHPQLVHARVRTLRAKCWPQITPSDLMLKSDDIERVRAEARQRLLKEFPSNATRLLAYRLSVVIGDFSRKLAIAIGGVPSAIQMAGEVFDHLVGPWIEQKDTDRYRISPLLKGAADNTLALSEINAIHVAIARDYMNRHELSCYEIGTAFFHAFMAKDLGVLGAISNSIFNQDSKRLALIYDAMSWFSLVSLDVGQRIIEGDVKVEMMLRLAQFKLVVVAEKSENALQVVDRMEELLGVIEDSNFKKLSEAMVCLNVLTALNFYMPFQNVVRMLSRLIDTAVIIDLNVNRGNLDSSFCHPIIHANGPEQALLYCQVARIRGLDDLAALIDALEELPKEKRDLLLSVCDSNFDFATLLIGRAWWSDVQNGNLNVDKALETLQRVEVMSRRWGVARLVRSCQVARSVIYDEYGHSIESALAVLDLADAEFPNGADLVNQRSKVLFHANRGQEALVVAERALSFSDISSVEHVFTCRDAGVTSAKLGDWGRATNFFERGARRALQSSIQKPMGIGLMADAAIGYWKQSMKQKSILMFSEVLEQLGLTPLTDDIIVHHLHATVRHCIAWIHFEENHARSSDLVEPPPGMCSNQEPNEGIKEHRIINIAASWLLLYQTEIAVGIDCGVRKKFEKFSETEQSLVMVGYKRMFDFKRALRTPPWDDLIHALVRMLEVLDYSRECQLLEQKGMGWQVGEIPRLSDEYWQKAENWGFIYQALLAACINCLAFHPEHPFPVEKWRRDLTALAPLSLETTTFLCVLEGQPAGGSLFQKVGAGLVALREGAVAVETLLRISVWLLNVFELQKQLISNDVEVLITKCWAIAADNQRFAFIAPSLAIPEIKDACADQTHVGLAKVAVIVKVAAPYLSVHMTSEAKSMIARIAAS